MFDDPKQIRKPRCKFCSYRGRHAAPCPKVTLDYTAFRKGWLHGSQGKPLESADIPKGRNKDTFELGYFEGLAMYEADHGALWRDPWTALDHERGTG